MVILILMSCVYLLVFIPPNLTGAKDPNMLAAFRDEFPIYGSNERVQFKVLISMMTSTGTLYETLKNTLFYGYYNYGYTFFLTSALMVFPLRLVGKLFQSSISTTAYMVILRQLSPLFMLTAILLLVYLWTGFKSMVKSVLLFVFLGSIPAIFLNNMFWHPDSLLTLFVVFTIFSLAKDQLRFGTWYYMAAASCGLATGTKVIGLFFFLAVAVYLVLGLLHQSVTLRGFLKHGFMAFVMMVLIVVLSNPLLLIPNIAKQYGAVLTEQAERNAWWLDRKRVTDPLWWYTEPGPEGSPTLQDAFGFWWLYVLVLLGCLLGIAYNREKRILNIIILTWIMPASLYLLFLMGHKGSPDFIPVFLPMMSCIGNLFGLYFGNGSGRGKTPALVLAGTSILLCALQFAYYVPTDLNAYVSILNRENRSSSIRFYQQLSDIYLSRLSQNERISIVREVKLYLPPSPNWDDDFKWGMFGYDYINDIKPDLILLSTDAINRRSDPAQISDIYPPDREQWLRSYDFYHDAKMGSLTGFCKLLETDFGVAFVSTPECLRRDWCTPWTAPNCVQME